MEEEAFAMGVRFSDEDTNEEIREKINIRRELINRAVEIGASIDLKNDTNEEIEAKIEWKKAALEAMGIGAEIEETDTLEEILEKHNKKILLNQEALELKIDVQYKTAELGNRILAKYVLPYRYFFLDNES
ncbi:MAG: hypothetical protein WBK54_02195 [Bacilli bacterium]|nr:hypothetical protein [Acholeplasmataceae bacterium]